MDIADFMYDSNLHIYICIIGGVKEMKLFYVVIWIFSVPRESVCVLISFQ